MSEDYSTDAELELTDPESSKYIRLWVNNEMSKQAFVLRHAGLTGSLLRRLNIPEAVCFFVFFLII